LIQPGHIRAAFDENAARYDRHAALEREACERLLERVTFQRVEPDCVLDLGCGTGGGAEALRTRFRKARVVALDSAAAMLSEAGERSRLMRRFGRVQGDLNALPFPRHSADLVFSNLALPWLAEPPRFLGEVLRVLRPGGMFLFSTYGPETLEQLHEAATASSTGCEAPGFPDLLEIGDALTATGFREPVMDVDRITLDYPSLAAMGRELEVTGTAMLVGGWPAFGANSDALAAHWPAGRAPDRFPLTFEVVYGAAYGPPEGQPRRTQDGEVATFSVDSLLKSRSMS
jgi:malonyl-CoA O-methyltransferase